MLNTIDYNNNHTNLIDFNSNFTNGANILANTNAAVNSNKQNVFFHQNSHLQSNSNLMNPHQQHQQQQQQQHHHQQMQLQHSLNFQLQQQQSHQHQQINLNQIDFNNSQVNLVF